MRHTYEEPGTGAFFRLSVGEPAFRKGYLEGARRTLTIAWNRGEALPVLVDGAPRELPAQAVLPLMTNQTVALDDAKSVVFWEFNRDFYCIVDHDAEVSCVGLLFYGLADALIRLGPDEQRRFDLLQQVFVDEFETQDTIQGEMLRVLLKRLIIKLTRLLKEQQPPARPLGEGEMTLVRQFNLLVENHYRRKHSVAEYADLLHRSPKTLANLFAAYRETSPLQIIHERIAQEAKRLLLYTDKYAKEIADELGFAEVAHFSRFFKKQVGVAPSEFKASQKSALAGSNGNTPGSFAISAG